MSISSDFLFFLLVNVCQGTSNRCASSEI